MSDTEKKSNKKADHGSIASDGKAVERIEEATGISYSDLASGKATSFQVGGIAGDTLTMLALFGAKTLATNSASQCRQAKLRGDGDGDEIGAINARFALIKPGVWAPRGEGGGKRGPKYNLATLAAALIAVMTKKKLDPDTVDNYVARMTDDLAYRRKVQGNSAVMVEYHKLAETESDVSDLL